MTVWLPSALILTMRLPRVSVLRKAGSGGTQ